MSRPDLDSENNFRRFFLMRFSLFPLDILRLGLVRRMALTNLKHPSMTYIKCLFTRNVESTLSALNCRTSFRRRHWIIKRRLKTAKRQRQLHQANQKESHSARWRDRREAFDSRGPNIFPGASTIYQNPTYFAQIWLITHEKIQRCRCIVVFYLKAPRL